MAFIAGYVAARPQHTEAILERVRDFSILPGESGCHYGQAVTETRFGHLIIKHKSGYPIKPQIESDADGNALAILGFVVSSEDTKTRLALAVRTEGRSLEECEGEFVAVFADAATGAVHIVNDRFSSRPLYTMRCGHGVYFSSNLAFLLTLAQVSYRPDVVGWLQVGTAAHTLGTRTTADGVERLRPATHLTISPDRVRERQYWRLEHRPDPDLDPKTHAEEVFEAFRASADRRARLVGKGILALSGGLDSRLVAGGLPRGADFSAFTFVDDRNAHSTAETQAAAAVCAALGMRHHIKSLPARFTRPSEVIALTGGMRSYQHMANAMPYVDEIRRRGTSFLLGGGPGDSLAGAFVPSRAYLDPARMTECISDACRQRLGLSMDWSLVFRDDVIEYGRRAVHDAFAESFAAVTGPTAAHRATAWAMVYRQPAFTFTSVLHTHPDVTEAGCHLDYRYADLMLRLPASWLYHKAFYSYMIYSSLPHLRHIPYANTGRLLSGEPPTHESPREPLRLRMLARAESLGRRAIGPLYRSVTPARTQALSLPFTDTVLLDEVKECVRSIPLLRDIVDVRRCDRVLEQARAGTTRSNEVLGVLTSLCISAATLTGEYFAPAAENPDLRNRLSGLDQRT